jgi:hypothetical protein
MDSDDKGGRFDRYREQLDDLIGVKSVVYDVEPRVEDDGRVLAVSYAETPKSGYVTGFTYGLSLFGGPGRGSIGRELCITVRSSDIEWSKVPARVVADLRGIAPFVSGNVFGYVRPYVQGSAMNSLVLAKTPFFGTDFGLLDPEEGREFPAVIGMVEILGAYPIYASERDFVRSHGFDTFWGMEWDRADPARGAVV